MINGASDWGYPTVVLEVESSNFPAIKLYTKMGFERVGEVYEKGGVEVGEGGTVEDRIVELVRMEREV